MDIDENELLSYLAELKTTSDAAIYLRDHIFSELMRFTMVDISEFDLFFETDFDQILDYLQIFEYYLNALIKIKSTWIRIAQKTRENSENNAKSVTAMVTFMQRLTSNTSTSLTNSNQELFCIRKTKFSSTIFSYIVEYYGINHLLIIFESNKLNDKCIKTNLLKFVVSNSVRVYSLWNVDEVNFVSFKK